MADRIFKGKLQAETPGAFPEASSSFDTPHAGGLVPFELFRDALHNAQVTRTSIQQGSLFISAEDVWIKIDRDGTVEIGTAGV